MNQEKGKIYILPTADIVRETSALDPFFHFLRGGAKGIVREAILSYCLQQANPLQSLVVGHVLKQYEKHLQAKQEQEEEISRFHLCEVSPTFSIEEYFDNVGKIEHVVSSMEEMVRQMLEGIFERRLLDIHEKGSGWLYHDYYAPIRLSTSAPSRRAEVYCAGDWPNLNQVHLFPRGNER